MAPYSLLPVLSNANLLKAAVYAGDADIVALLSDGCSEGIPDGSLDGKVAIP